MILGELNWKQYLVERVGLEPELLHLTVREGDGYDTFLNRIEVVGEREANGIASSNFLPSAAERTVLLKSNVFDVHCPSNAEIALDAGGGGPAVIRAQDLDGESR